MKLRSIVTVLLLPLAAMAQHTSELPSGKYSWVAPQTKMAPALLSSPILSGTSIDLKALQVDACSLASSKKNTTLRVPSDMEYLLILKSGTMNVSFGNVKATIGRGSVCILSPGQEFTLQASDNNGCNFYLMKYTAATPVGRNEETAKKSFITDWNNLEFKPHDKGGVRKYFERPTSMFRRLEMHVTTLNQGLKSHDPHTHRAGEIILMMDDERGQTTNVDMFIGDHNIAGSAGDLYYVEPNILHGITNNGSAPCSYFAFQFQ
jgi:(S)-ureidoglycine aminohydrolase